jgi:ribosomal-protein-alanine N-acetyltransferase
MIALRTELRRVIGNLSLTQITRGPAHHCVMGYSLAEGLQGKGYMLEAVRGAVGYAFGELGLHRIAAGYMPHNRRSATVLRRAGFTVEGYARDYLRIDGQWEDHILTGIVNPSWSG